MKKSKEKLNQKGIKMHSLTIITIVLDVFMLLIIIVPYIRKRVRFPHLVVLAVALGLVILVDGFTAKTMAMEYKIYTLIAWAIGYVLVCIIGFILMFKDYKEDKRKNEIGCERNKQDNRGKDNDISEVSFSDSDEK